MCIDCLTREADVMFTEVCVCQAQKLGAVLTSSLCECGAG